MYIILLMYVGFLGLRVNFVCVVCVGCVEGEGVC